jgi:5'-3' exonuclease
MRLHLVDGTFELFRAHFSKRPDGPRKATLGFVDSMLALLEDAEERVTHIAVAFDNPIRSIRNDWFEGYKTEEGVAPELLAQFDAVEEAARALGIVVWSMDRYEADDAIATAAARWRAEVDQVRMLTPDKDLGQALVGQRVVMVDRVRRRVIDEQELLRMRGIQPSSVPDWLALVGDTADGIPGIEGFGEKTASALLRAFGRIEDIPREARAWPPAIRGAERLAPRLAAEREKALLYRKLATLFVDVPLAERLEDLAWSEPPPEAFAAWCDAAGVESWKARPRRADQSASSKNAV